MPVLFIDCPETGKPVSTDKLVPKSMPADHLIGNIMKCEACQKFHKWEGRQAYYYDEEGAKVYLS
ncbi:MAG TPA: hypothetical protein VGB71_04830 [Flavisolibacter sp.]|jgi:hypothetical protein